MGLFKKTRKMFGEILVDGGLAKREDIDDALRIQKELWETKKIQKHIGEILAEKGIIDVEGVQKTLAEQKKMQGFLLNGWVYSIFGQNR